MTKFTVLLKNDVSIQDLSDLMVTALEGGINYWCRKAKITKFPENLEEELSMSADEVVANGGEIKLYDAESDDTWVLNRDKLLIGIKLHCDNINSTVSEMIENHDAGDADSIVQYAIFSELIFG